MKSSAFTAIAALLFVAALTALAGCHADPHDTHVATPAAAAPR